MVETVNNLILWNEKADDLETFYTASGTQAQPNCSTDGTGLTLTIFMTLSNVS